MSTVELRAALKDTHTSKNEKIAATMMLAGKEGYKSRDELQGAKSNLSKLPSLLKEFNESADKRFGHWNNSEEGFKGKVSDGTISVKNLDTSQLKDDQKAVELVATVSGVEFGSNLEAMAKTDVDRDNLRSGLGRGVEDRGFSGDDMRIRRAYAAHSGEVVKAHKDKHGNLHHADLVKTMSGARPKHLGAVSDADISTASFRSALVGGTDIGQLKRFQRSEEAPEKLEKYLKIIKKAAAAGNVRAQEIEHGVSADRELNSIYQKV